jgi:hypothetical protein|tara:strand:- start:715 stop:918 length:204 start_codon:yes stop_codon:yes gene_type:complete
MVKLERSDAFWNTPEEITEQLPTRLTYEDFLGDLKPYFDWAAASLGIHYDVGPQARYAIQQKARTDE